MYRKYNKKNVKFNINNHSFLMDIRFSYPKAKTYIITKSLIELASDNMASFLKCNKNNIYKREPKTIQMMLLYSNDTLYHIRKSIAFENGDKQRVFNELTLFASQNKDLFETYLISNIVDNAQNKAKANILEEISKPTKQ